jgi:hypothetical protein
MPGQKDGSQVIFQYSKGSSAGQAMMDGATQFIGFTLF